ncbi:MAG: hypothetical protein NTW98_01860 [Candidatus Nomurabacteria bacterium]|nr:hypothetical protein [Candidatus Nomurabacteria bacterium]
MLNEDKDKLNRLEELKRRLSNNSYKTKIEYYDNYSPEHHHDVPESWQDENKKPNDISQTTMKTSIFKKFFIFSIIFFLLASLYVAYQFFAGGNTVSNDNINIAILGNTFTAGGEVLPLQVEITNKNSSQLELVDLVVEYPNGSSKTENGNESDTERIRTSLGAIPSGGVRNENMDIVLFGEQGSEHNVKVSIEYRVEGSNAIFVKEKDYLVTISSTPIDLVVDGPGEVNPGEDMTLKVRTTLNATRPAIGMLVKAEYPLGFQFIKSTPSPTLGNNVWSLGDLSPGAESNITIVGRMVDVVDGEEKTFKIYSGSQAKNDKAAIGVVFNSVGYIVAVERPFIAAKLFVNGVYDREYAIDSKTPILAQINYTNNLDVKLNNVEIRAKISGNGFNKNSLRAPKGYYDSLNNTVIWNKDYDSTLASLSPYQNGSVNFTVSPLSLFVAGGGFINQPTVNIEVSIIAQQLLEGNITKKLENSESKIVRISSDLGLSAKALYYSGPFKNSGPIPPKAEVETTYTVVWSITNTANNVSRAQVKSSLPPFIGFVGNVSPSSEEVTYNASTREIVWNISGVPKGTGITAASREVAFQISLTPSVAQIGEVVKLINPAVLTGHDDFANVDLRVDKSFLNTGLTNDPLSPKNGAKVVE